MAFARLARSIAYLAAPLALGSSLLTLMALPAFADGDPTVRVKAGDTLTSISLAQYGDVSHVQTIATYNRLTDPNKLYAGQILRLPARGIVAAAPATKSVPASLQGV